MTAPWKPSERTSGRFRVIELVDETGSTNRDLAERASQGAPAGQVLIARHQTAGRGRQGRTWFDQPDSSLLMSWSVDVDASIAPLLSLVTGTAMCRAVGTLVGHETAALKWPNDVLVPAHGERKLAGILAEVATVAAPEAMQEDGCDPGKSLRVVMGMGVNVDLDLDNAPAEVVDRAVDLRSINGTDIDRAQFVNNLLDACDVAIDELEASVDAALDAYRSRCITLGRSIRFETSVGDLEGRATAVGRDGALVLQTDDGITHRLTAGDAHHRSS